MRSAVVCSWSADSLSAIAVPRSPLDKMTRSSTIALNLPTFALVRFALLLLEILLHAFGDLPDADVQPIQLMQCSKRLTEVLAQDRCNERCRQLFQVSMRRVVACPTDGSLRGRRLRGADPACLPLVG